MLVDNKNYQSIWLDDDQFSIKIIDQRRLPYELEILTLSTVQETMIAIRDMYVRGAPLIGITAAFGVALAMREDTSNKSIERAFKILNSARPTAINLRWALEKISRELKKAPENLRRDLSLQLALELMKKDIDANTKIGRYGYSIIEKIANTKINDGPVRILTHCNAGWLATVDRGTATAPIYEAKENGIDVEVWVDETRPRNQGASLTTWELFHNNVPHTLIVDNAGGHLMQKGLVDLVIVGSDRTTVAGDVCNKIGTYLKALAAFDNNVPFYAALPISTIDFSLEYGSEIPIENRSEREVTHITGVNSKNNIDELEITLQNTKAFNPAFDVTPAKYISGLITDFGVIKADKNYIEKLRDFS